MFRRPKKQSEVLLEVPLPVDFPTLHSLELVYDLVKDRIGIQMDQSDKLDAKAYSLMTSATAIVGAALILQAVLPTLHSFPHGSVINEVLQIAPLTLLLMAYLGVMITAIFAYKLRTYYQSPDPIILYQNYLEKSERFTRAKVLRSLIDDYTKNEKEISEKIKWNKWAITALWIETLLFVAYLLLHAVS